MSNTKSNFHVIFFYYVPPMNLEGKSCHSKIFEKMNVLKKERKQEKQIKS